jgi:hypothetical protein
VSLKLSAERVHAAVDRVAAGVVMVARGLAWASFGSAIVISTAVLLELEERPAHWVLALIALAALLSIPGWVLLAFRAAVSSARDIPGAVGTWHQKARHHYGRLTASDGGLNTGAAAARAAWEGGREVGALKAGLAATRLSFVIAALVCAVLVPVEVVLAVTVVLATAIF